MSDNIYHPDSNNFWKNLTQTTDNKSNKKFFFATIYFLFLAVLD